MLGRPDGSADARGPRTAWLSAAASGRCARGWRSGHRGCVEFRRVTANIAGVVFAKFAEALNVDLRCGGSDVLRTKVCCPRSPAKKSALGRLPPRAALNRSWATLISCASSTTVKSNTVRLFFAMASFRAKRINVGLASLFADSRWSRRRFPCFKCGATSVSQIKVLQLRPGRRTVGRR